MLTTKQKRTLKAMANTLKPIYQIGKNGPLNETSITMLNNALVAHELIKINVLKTAGGDLKEIALDLSGALRCEIVQILGRIITLYRHNPKIQGIKLD